MTDTRIDEKALERRAVAVANLQNTEEVYGARDKFLKAPTGENWRHVLEAVWDEITAARKEAGFVEVPGWRPIETAPNNGTEVLGCCSGNYDAEVVWFGSCETLDLSDSEAEKIDEETFWAETWWTNERDGACRLEGDVAPTHWMPKPPAMIAKAT